MGPHKSDPGDAGPFSPIPEQKPDDKTRSFGHHGDTTADPAITALPPVQVPGSKSTTDKKEPDMEEMQEFLEDLGEDSYAVAFYLGCLGVGIVSAIGFVLLPWSWIVAIICVLLGFLIVS